MKKLNISEQLTFELKPLIDSGILIVQKKGGEWDLVKIQGNFDYFSTKKILFNCLSILRNGVHEIQKTGLLSHIINKKDFGVSIYIIDKVTQAFLQALSVKPLDANTSLNLKILWSHEMQFLMESQRIVTAAFQDSYQSVQEKLVIIATFISAVALLIGLFNNC